MNTSFTIRKARTADTNAITQFNIAMAWETENKELNESIVLKGVQAVMDNELNGFYLIAQKDNQTVGCLLTTFEWSDWRNSRFWWIQSVYVLPDYRKQGIFTSLYQNLKTMAKTQGNVCGFRLYVEKNNHTGQKTYKKLGMHPTDYYMYEEPI